MFLAIDTIQLISVALVLVLLFLGFRIFESKYSYKISKPYKWENAIKNELISPRLKNIESTYRDKVRFYNLWFQVVRLKKNNIKGAFAEVGVYKGETAEMLAEMDPSREIHLFDTFTGFDKSDLENETKNDAKYNKDNFSDVKLEDVKRIFTGNLNVHFYPGYFPETASGLKEKTFSLVHLDADLYNPTLAGLRYFYPKLSAGGVILIHDYNHTWNGINKAVDEFAAEIPESIIEITDWQGTAMIIRNSQS